MRRGLLAAIPLAVMATPAHAHGTGRLHVYPGRLLPADRPDAAIAVFEIHAGRAADVLRAASTDAARAVVIVGPDGRPRPDLPIPARSDLELVAGGPHLRLEGLAQPLAPGRTVRLSLDFVEAGRLTAVVRAPRR